MPITHSIVAVDDVTVFSAAVWNANHVLESLIPSAHDSHDLGEDLTRWKDAYFSGQIKSSLATGTAPFIIASTTVVTNLNVDLLDGYHYSQVTTDIATHAGLTTGIHGVGAGNIVGTTLVQTLTQKTLTSPDINGGTVDAITSLTVANNVDIGSFELRAQTFQSDVATGTAPFIVASTTVVSNLNADLWDGYQFVNYLDQAVKTTSDVKFGSILRQEYGGSLAYRTKDTTQALDAKVWDLLLQSTMWKFRTLNDAESSATEIMVLTRAGQLQLPTTGSGGGLLIGGDVQLYRSAADMFYIPDSVTLAGGLTVGGIILIDHPSGDAMLAIDAYSTSYDASIAFKAGGTYYALFYYDPSNDQFIWNDYGGVNVMTLGVGTGNLGITGGLTVGSDIVSDTADTDSLGSTSKEWLNLYIGDAGRIYLGLGQDISLYRASANILQMNSNSGIRFRGNDNACHIINKICDIAGSGTKTFTFTSSASFTTFTLETVVTGYYTSGAGTNSIKWANSYCLNNNVEQEDNQATVYSLGGEVASLTMTIAPAGSGNQFIVTISNGSGTVFNGYVTFVFFSAASITI